MNDLVKAHHFVGRSGNLATDGELWTAGRGTAADRFDLSSLTKPIVSSTLLMMTCERSQWSWENFLEIRISDNIPELETTELKDLKLRHLWEHRSGLAAHIDFLCGAKAGAEPARGPRAPDWQRGQAWQQLLVELLAQVRQQGLSPGGSCYSDLGFLLLGLWLERFYGRSIDELWRDWKQNHGLASTALPFFGTQHSASGLVPTENRHALGEVNDNNAFFLGGVAPHAGLIGGVSEVWAWLQAVKRWTHDAPKISPWCQVPAEWSWRFYCGWDRPGDAATTTAGRGAPADTLGHLGYTGTALWWSPAQDRAGILLTNRIHPAPSAQNAEMIKFVRREFFTALWQGTLNSTWQIPISKNGST